MGLEDRSGWIALAGQAAAFPAVVGDLTADYAIVGGGVTGLAAARRLAEIAPGKRIVLIDGKRLGQGASARNSGFAVAHESPVHADLNSPEGRARYALTNGIDRAGVAELQRLVAAHRIDCDWEDTGTIYAAHDVANFDTLQRHWKSSTDLGIDAQLIERDALARRLGTSHYGLGVETRGGALLQPGKLLRGLVEALPPAVEAFENSPVRRIARAGAGWALELYVGTVRAAKVIVGVNAFLPRLGLKRMRVFPLALTASLTRALSEEEEERIGRPDSWGILSPRPLGATVRLTRSRRILIRNTAEYARGGITPAMLAARRRVHAEGLARRFPFLGEADIEHSWSGAVCISRNERPVFEETAPGLFLCGCYDASGLSRGTILGRLIADLAEGGADPLLADAIALGGPSLIPPRPVFGIAAKLRLAWERRRGATEV